MPFTPVASARRNMSGRAARGARPLPSMTVSRPSGRRMTIAATPPIPLSAGSATPMTNAAVTAASTALPPSRSTSSAASVASGRSVVTIA